MISEKRRLLCEKLYKEEQHTIKEIMRLTGIRSEQTIYRILDDAGIPRRPVRNTVLKKCISLDQETVDIINIGENQIICPSGFVI